MKGLRLEEVIEAKAARDGKQAADDLLHFGTAFSIIANYMRGANAGRTLNSADGLALREVNRCITQLAKSLKIKLPEASAVLSAINADVDDMFKEEGEQG